MCIRDRVQTANSLEAAAVVSGLSSKMTAQEQAYRVGQAWEALPEPKRQITFYVVSPGGEAQSFHIGPHAPSLQADDVELVHRLWLNFRRDPQMQDLHHSDIVTHALTRLAAEYARDKQETLLGLRRRVQDVDQPKRLGEVRIPGSQAGIDYGVPVSYTHLDVYKRQILAWSKILPQVAHFIANRSVGKFEFIPHEACLLYTSRCV